MPDYVIPIGGQGIGYVKPATKPLRIFISSPYSNGDTLTDTERQANVDRSLDVAEQLAQRGHYPLPPLLSHHWNQRHPRDYEYWMAWCMEWLAVCDCLLRLHGESAGASVEERAAKEIGMAVYYRIEDIPDVGNE